MKKYLAVAVATLLMATAAQAALIDRGGGMLYDTELNITWLQDANYAKTSGYCETSGNCYPNVGPTGQMTWTQANNWANDLVYGGYSDWRLARNSPVNGTPSGWIYQTSFNGSMDVGYNITSTFSELSYMYYVNLGLKGAVNPDGSPRLDYGVSGDGTSGGQKDIGLVRNLPGPNYYWSSLSARSPYICVGLCAEFYAWSFDFSSGYQSDMLPQSSIGMAWAVHDGDVLVSAVPEPETYALMLVGLALVGAAAKRRK